MQTPKKRRTGRPGREPNPGERVGMSLRVTPETKRRLDAAAMEKGRSLSQEAEVRLDQSFHDEDAIKGALALAYGRRFAGILLVLARAMREAGWSASLMKTGSFESAAEWLNDPWAYEQAVQAATTVLEAFRPEGEILPPPPPVDPITHEPRGEDFWDDMPTVGVGFANHCLEAIRGNEQTSTPAMREWADELVRDMLGTRLRLRPHQLTPHLIGGNTGQKPDC
jgi:hypothetical protein